MARLLGKTAIVTGASSGIGFEAAKLFAKQGAKVVVGARRQAKLEDVVADIKSEGGKAVALAGDVADENYAKALVELARKEFGGLNIAFNNAGILGPGEDTSATSLNEWLKVINTNLTSAFLCAKYQIPEMLKSGSGSIVFTSSFVGFEIGLPGKSAYAASKTGLIGLMRVMASEYGQKGIRVNVLMAGGTDTPMSQAFITSAETLKFVNSIHALKRMAKPEEIASAALFLASDESSFVTGSVLYADGGVSISKT